MDHNLAFIGGGNMARSLIGGLLSRGAQAARIAVADPLAAAREALHSACGVRVSDNNLEAARDAQVVILAVKPQQLRAVVTGLQSVLATQRPLLISIAAGIHASDIRRWGGGIPVVRCMPNRPALQGCGVTGLFATDDVAPAGRTLAESILGAVGATVWLEQEAHLDAVTAISGSGPAYFFLLIEMLEQAGIALGLPAQVSRKLAIDTAWGSGCMAHDAKESPATLREQVTSKGGTTEAALKVLEAQKIRDLFSAAVTAAARRSAQLADELGKL